MKIRSALGLALAPILSLPAFGAAPDWPGWRGPHRDGTSKNEREKPSFYAPEATCISIVETLFLICTTSCRAFFRQDVFVGRKDSHAHFIRH